MPETSAETSTSTENSGFQLSQLVPSFDPAVDSVEAWGQKISILLAAWPPGKLQELATRIVLNTKGSAFQKLQLRQKEIFTGTSDGIKKIVEIVGGTFGQVPLEKKYELVEKAIYRCSQKSDETSDSYIARADVVWADMLARSISLAEIQAYTILRGSKLQPEDKKRVLVESGAEQGGMLEMPKVEAAIRMLGSNFFQEYTSGKKDKNLKTYDHTAFAVEEAIDDHEPTLMMSGEDVLDDVLLESLAIEDEDAALVLQFEGAIVDSVQEDPELCAFFSSYQEARRRLIEKTKSRGFWPVGKGGKGKKGFSKGKGKGPRKSLAQRIAESECRLCHQRGHWKAECPNKNMTQEAGKSNQVPVSYAVAIPSELEDIPEMVHETWPEFNECFCFGVSVYQRNFSYMRQCLKEKLRSQMPRNVISKSNPESLSRETSESQNADIAESCPAALFASSGTVGVVDLGASQSVIGSKQVPELMSNLPEKIRKAVRRSACSLVFRFGNHQTLQSRTALMFPLQGSWFRVAVVEGQTPFLLSSQFLKRTLKAVIDVDEGTLWSKTLNRYILIEETAKNLFLMDLNQLWETMAPTLQVQVQEPNSAQTRETENNEEPLKTVSFENSENKISQTEIVNPNLSSRGKDLKIHECAAESFEQDDVPQKNVSQPGQPLAQAIRSEPITSSKDNQNVDQPALGRISLEPREAPQSRCDPGRHGEEPDHLRRSPSWQNLCRSLPGQEVDSLVCEDLRALKEAGTPTIHPLCVNEGVRDEQRATTIEFRDADSIQCGDRRASKEDPRSNDGSNCDFLTRSHGTREPMDAQPRSPSGNPTGRCLQDRSEIGCTGRSNAGSDQPPSQTDHDLRCSMECGEKRGGEQLRDIVNGSQNEMSDCLLAQYGESPEMDFDFATSDLTNLHQKCRQMISQFRMELNNAKKFVKPKRNQTFMFEVMCSANSEITRQCLMQNQSARRFGLREGDLRSKASRQNLFAHLVAEHPENLWISPECRPWCKWSELNASKSIEMLDKILLDREQTIWQVSLAIVLCEFQIEQGNHFHLEQPAGSKTLTLPDMKPIFQVTKACSFDLCSVGNLRDPMTKAPIRKRLVVCTSSPSLFETLNHRFCQSDHQHQHVAGSTRYLGNSVALSKFTEMYPRKFARQIIQTLKKPCAYCFAGESEHPSKRRRLGDKSSRISILLQRQPVTWNHVMQAVDAIAKRVGVQVVEKGMLVDAIQSLNPDHEIKHVVICRGTDRMLGPCKPMLPGIAPVRRMVCIRRRFEDIYEEDKWEPWEKLSHRQLRRKTVSARCNLTIFARPKFEEPSASTENQRAPSENQPQPRPESEPNIEPEAKRLRVNPSEKSVPNSDQGGPEKERLMIDLVSQKHGPEFLKLLPEERSWLLKIHRNMGHPGVQKLQTYCKQIGCSDAVSKAIPHLKCSTCEETKSPHIPRPSAIHENLDFGDIISTDGVTFVNKQGHEFHFYHFVDHGTNFQVASCAPARTTESAIRTLTQGWIHWAGPPGMICADSAGEFTAGGYAEFLQKHGIKLRIIPPESHWQNARAERHGGILQEILRKMDLEEAIDSYEKLEEALAFATQTKNQWSKYRGFPPEVLVFGRLQRIPGSHLSDPDLAAHAKALSELPDGIRFRTELMMRERARRAFCQVDNEQSFRRALLQRSRPARGFFQKGDWVMLWRQESKWIGPMKVVLHEDQKVVWLSLGNKMYRASPEHVRSLSAMEETSVFQKADERPTTLSQPPSNHPVPEQLPGGEGVPDNPQVIRQRSESSGQPEPEIPPRPASEENPEKPTEEDNKQAELLGTPNQLNEQNDTTQPENIPIPEDDADEELFAKAFMLSNEEVWRYEIELNDRDINELVQSTHEEQIALLVSAAKRQKAEVQLAKLNPEEQKQFAEAKDKELQSWIDTEAIATVLRRKIPPEQILRCRWILSWKDAETNSHLSAEGRKPPNRKAKARLVVLGFEDPLLAELERDSPTLTKLSRSLLLQIASSKHWTIGSFDVRTAFLRGRADQSRILGLEPPKELRQKLKMKDEEVCQLLKGAYGRADAPLLWFRELTRGLKELQFEQSPFDPCLFTLSDEKGDLMGAVGIHVDDGLFCGNAEFHKRINLLEKKYPFGSRKQREFTFTGLHISQKADHSIWVDQTQYVKDISPITVNQNRRKNPEASVTEEERQALRAVIGSLQYASVNTRPDLGSRLGALQGRINCATIQDLLDANKTLHEAKMYSDTCIKYQPIPLESLRFVAFSDASFASEKNRSSHQGMIIVAADECIGKNQTSPINPIVWASRKIQKVTVSTLSSEAMAMAGTVDTLAWVRLYWGWLMNSKCQWRLGDETLKQLPPAFSAWKDDEELEDPNPSLAKHLENLPKMETKDSIIATDCKSLYDLVNRNAAPSCQEFRTMLQAKLIKEHLDTGVQIRWVPSGAQVADALTKTMDNTVLRECLRLGIYKLHDEQALLKTRADARTRVRWLRENTQGKAKSSLSVEQGKLDFEKSGYCEGNTWNKENFGNVK